MSLFDVKALCFDVFGTVVDWRASIAREAATLLGRRGIERDWRAFADAWRARYQPAMEEVQQRPAPLGPARRSAPREPAGAARRGADSPGSAPPRSTISTAPGTGSTPGRTRSRG